MQNGNYRPHRGWLLSRAESEAINHPIIEEFARLCHHILANVNLSFGRGVIGCTEGRFGVNSAAYNSTT
jgi:hypothetical protein